MTRKLISAALFFLTVAALGAIYLHSEKARADSPAASQPRTTDTIAEAHVQLSFMRTAALPGEFLSGLSNPLARRNTMCHCEMA